MSSSASWLESGIGIIDTGGYGSNETIASYVLSGDNSAGLIDVGYSTTWQTITRGLAELGIAPKDVSYIFLTHFHLDHAGASNSLLKYLPNAKIVVHEKAIRHLIDPSKLVDGARSAFGNLGAKIGSLDPIQPERLEPARDESYALGGLTLQPLFTPGHAPSHLSFYTNNGVLFTGDVVCVKRKGIDFMVPAASPPIYDVPAALKSLETIQSMRPRKLLAPHFGEYPTTDSEFENQKAAVQTWLDEISSKMDEGLNAQQITEFVVHSVLLKDRDPNTLDDFTRDVLLGSLIRMTVEAYMSYLLSRKT